MNYIDKQFYSLINEISNRDTYTLYAHMLKRFKSVAPVTQQSVENFLNKYKFWGDFDSANENYRVFYLRAQLLHDRLGEFVSLYHKLADYRSKFVLFAVLNNIYNQDYESLKKATEYQFRHYFDLNLLPHCENGVFVDVGAYTGDTALDFVASYGENYRKIYCYEMTESMRPYIEGNLAGLRNIVYKNYAVSDKKEQLYCTENVFSPSANTTGKTGEVPVQAVTLDEDIPERIDLIKMDIEGGEKKALLGAQNHIKNDTPILFISVYHGNTDILDIPAMIKKMNKNYNYHLRYYGGCVYPTEIVLICIPKRRKCKKAKN